MVEPLRLLVIGLMGAIGSVMANRGISVYNDGLRPVLPEWTEGRMKKRELASISFAVSFGLVVGFGIPFSLLYPILLIHALWLGTDIIGTFMPGPPAKSGWMSRDAMIGVAASGVIGLVYGVGIVLGLGFVTDAIKALPVPFFDALSAVGDPIVYAFAAFPAVAVALQYGWKNGAIALTLTFLARQITYAYAKIPVAGKVVTVSGDGIALAVGMIILIIYALREKPTGETQAMAKLFTQRVSRIKKNLPIIAVTGALYGLGINQLFTMEGPLSLVLAGKGDIPSAIIVTVARAISFIPLKGTTALATGVWVNDGFGFVATGGLLSPNPVVALVVGAVIMVIEALTLVPLASIMDRFPGMRKAADNIRTAMVKTLEVALLVGGALAGNNIASGLGFLLVVGVYLLNEQAGTPINRMAIGPVAAIGVGILANILKLLTIL